MLGRFLRNGQLALILSATAWAQGTSTINGSVKDASGAVIPATRITATELDTGLGRATVTNAEGLFVMGSLRPTRYRVTAEAQGFRQFLQTGITLQADDAITINMTLEVGATNETVTVVGAAVQVDTTSPTLKQVVDSARMVDLPLNGRNAASLTTLVAGAVNAPSDNADLGSVQR
jgi:Carboxypeptidase regulatory-like domain